MRLKDLLRARGIEFSVIDVETNEQAMASMKQRTGKSVVPQVFIDDEYIGGFEEFMLRDARGEIDARLGITRTQPDAPRDTIWDLVIIGAGPAGLTAAVYAARKNLKTILIAELLGGQPMTTWGVENYMGYQYITGPELMSKFEEQARQFDIRQHLGQPVTGMRLDGLLKEVTTADGQRFTGRTVIIASGKRVRRLGIPGESELAGQGVSYCATCDGPFFKGKPVMVAGGGNSALQSALELAESSPEVHLVSLTELTGDPVLIDKVNAAERIRQHILWRPLEIKGDKGVTAVVIGAVAGEETLEPAVEAIFIEIGLEPNTSFAVDLLQLNRQREIVVDCECRTGVQGVFAAGDVTQVRDKQIVVAAGEGAKAALSAHEYLLQQR
ncbi:MAG: FAD-dependent oxidoreductase [Thermoleophilia bacterium]